MRVQFIFHMKELNRAYRLGILSIIKQMIRQGSEDFYQKFFVNCRHKMKAFAYASYIRNMQINGETITGDELVLTISSTSYEFIMYLVNGSSRHNTYSYQGNNLELKSKRLLPKPPPFTSIVTFKTLSPLLIENHEQKPLLANDEGFEQEFNYYSSLILNEFFNRDLYQPIKIIQSSMKKVVLQENLHQTGDKPIFITANHGLLTLNGHPEDLKIIHDLGAGRRRSLGLGLLKVEEVIY